jgi:hypothetical protein
MVSGSSLLIPPRLFLPTPSFFLLSMAGKAGLGNAH